MAGSIRSRGDNTWEIRVFLGRDPTTGKQKFHCRTVHGTKRDAQSYLNKVLRERDLGTWVEPSLSSVATYLERWLREADRARASTKEFHAWVVSHYINPAIGSIQLGRLTPLHVQGFYNAMSDRELSPATIRRVHGVLSLALSRARRWGMIARNPADDVDLPKLIKRDMLIMGPEEARRFLDAAQDDRYRVLWAFALETGMRPGEYMAIRWSDLNIETGVAMIQRSLTFFRGGRWELTEPKTKSSRRKITLSPDLILALKGHRRTQVEERLGAGAAWTEFDLVFPSSCGSPIQRGNLTRRHFKPILKAAGLADLRLYDLRHGTATMLLSKGVNPKIVAERLGHSSITLTLQTYSHILPDMQQQATDTLGAILYGK